jgi:hypothetical protein
MKITPVHCPDVVTLKRLIDHHPLAIVWETHFMIGVPSDVARVVENEDTGASYLYVYPPTLSKFCPGIRLDFDDVAVFSFGKLVGYTRSKEPTSKREDVYSILLKALIDKDYFKKQEAKRLAQLVAALQAAKNNRQRTIATRLLRTPHEILGVNPTASQEEIRAAHRKLTPLYHPDKVSGLGKKIRDLAEAEMSAINWAYDQLTKQAG